MIVNKETKFNLGDKVYIKSQIGNYLSSNDIDREFIYLYPAVLLYQIIKIKVVVEINLDSQQIETKCLYDVKIYDIDKFKNFLKLENYRNITLSPEMTNISEENLYSLDEGKTLILNKLEDFKNYVINNL